MTSLVPPPVDAKLVCVGEGLAELSLDADDGAFAGIGAGGDAANTAVISSACGVPTALVGRVGDDALGSRLLAFWRGRGVDVSAVAVERDASTGLYISELRRNGSHTFTYHRRRSAGSRIGPSDLDAIVVGSADIVFTTGVTTAISTSGTDAARRSLVVARERGARSAFSINYRAPLEPDRRILLALAREADFVFASDADTAAIGAPTTALRIAGYLAPQAELVLTSGAGGACAILEGRIITCPAVPVDAADTVGAGDALAGAYLACRMSGAPVQTALKNAVFVAGLACQRRGAASGYPTREELTSAETER